MTRSGATNGKAGAETEREAVRLLTDLTGHEGRRLLGAGRADDRGDLDFPALRCAIQVTRVLHPEKDLVSRLTAKLADAEQQAARSGLPGAIVLARVSWRGRVLWRVAARGERVDRYPRYETIEPGNDLAGWEFALFPPALGLWSILPEHVWVTAPVYWWGWWSRDLPSYGYLDARGATNAPPTPAAG